MAVLGLLSDLFKVLVSAPFNPAFRVAGLVQGRLREERSDE